MTKRLRPILRFIFFLSLGFFFVWWSVKDITGTDRQQIVVALREARWWLAIPGFLILILSHVVRALRWRLLIEPLGHQPSKTNTFYAVMIGYLANQAVPRLGEVLKCSTLARYEKVPLDKLFGTVILERLIDTLCLGVIFLFTLAIQPELYDRIMNTFFTGNGGGGSQMNLFVFAALAIGVVVAVILLWMLITRKSLADTISFFKKIIIRVWEGISAIRHLKKRWAFVFYTIMLWFLYAICGYIGFIAFEQLQHHGFKEILMVLCAGSLGMVATPGGIGAYAFVLQKTMELYGANSGIALAYGWVMWLMQTIVILAGGLFSLAILPLKNKSRIPATHEK